MTRYILRPVAAASALLAFAAALSVRAQSRPVFETRGAFFALSVADLDASARWYADKLGLSVVMRPPKQDKSAVAVLEGGGLIVELLQRDDATALRQAAPSATESYQVHGIFKAGVIVDDLDATLTALRSRGVEIAMGPFPASKEQRANAIIRDNAGNLIQFFGGR
jgi:catechol 2,3-dioxygenase-like lactoylglutathione lyase family enzyme